MKIALALNESLKLYLSGYRWCSLYLSGYVCSWRSIFLGRKSRIYVGYNSPLLDIPLSYEYLRNSVCVPRGKVGEEKLNNLYASKSIR